jgi:hypothetical protein
MLLRKFSFALLSLSFLSLETAWAESTDTLYKNSITLAPVGNFLLELGRSNGVTIPTVDGALLDYQRLLGTHWALSLEAECRGWLSGDIKASWGPRFGGGLELRRYFSRRGGLKGPFFGLRGEIFHSSRQAGITNVEFTFYGPGLETGWQLILGRNFVLTPSIGVNYLFIAEEEAAYQVGYTLNGKAGEYWRLALGWAY